MNINLLLIACLISTICRSQTNYQIGICGGLSFPQTMRLTTGDIGLKFHHYKNYLADYNRMVNKKAKLSLGIQGQVTLFSGWVEPNKSISYYAEREHVPIFQFESAELMIYVKKNFQVYNHGNTVINSFVLAGPCFNFNEGNFTGRTYGVRDDNDQSFQIAQIEEKAQKTYIPYLRISGGLEFFRKLGGELFLGISPFISWIGFQSEENMTTVLMDDPAYTSTGNFKRNRSGYGIRLIFSK